MARSCLLALGLLATFACGGSSASGNQFAASMNGTGEVPAVASGGAASAAFQVSGTTVNYKVAFAGLSGTPTAAHIHLGSPAMPSGTVVVPFTGLPNRTSGLFEGSFTAADVLAASGVAAGSLDDLLTQMRAGNTYVNIHTAPNPDGEVRGQIHEN